MMEEMKRESDFVWLKPSDITRTIHDCKGEYYMDLFHKIRRIISYQFNNPQVEGIKGFIFHGDVGTGKTLMAKVLSKSLEKQLLFVDGSSIARKYYGESEQRIANIFNEAYGKTNSIILIDDAESIFPDRDWIKGQSWHVAQNNVFFHQLDGVNTGKTIVIMTTNKYNLLDKALKDRLYPIEFPQPDIKTLIEIIESECARKNMKPDNIIEEIRSNKKKYASIRDVEKILIEEYIRQVTVK
ncbi:MAG: ATP-binding protein [Candidatus Aenigmarchaeota archaeon]|nr:ATP-binding protein [Candidatus Aenigmarchaeota archaeon]